jgi:hypothetical protein
VTPDNPVRGDYSLIELDHDDRMFVVMIVTCVFVLKLAKESGHLGRSVKKGNPLIFNRYWAYC